MNTRHIRSGRAVRTGISLVAAVLVLVAAGTWRGHAAETQVPPASVTPRPTPGAIPPIARGRDSYADIVSAVAPAVVTVRTEARMRTAPAGFPDDGLFRRFFGDRSGETQEGVAGTFPGKAPAAFGLGSGVIVGADGYILTNHHVVDGADNIRVDLADGRSLAAKVVGSDPPSDLALLKIETAGLRPAALGDSDAMQVGDVVLAIGNPLGVGQTVTMGIVSAKGRSTGLGEGGYEDFLQTDAPINQGNSGGALVNTRGEVIGINSQIVSPSGGNIGIGFAIPANMARHVMTVLRTDGRVRRGQLGVTVQTVTSDLAAALGLKQVGGAVVSSVEPGSAAERAGVLREDVITSFDGHAVPDANSLRNRVADTGPGTRVSLVVVRNGIQRELAAQLDEASPQAARGPAGPDGESDGRSFGVSVTPLTAELASRIGVPPATRGLLVEDVIADSRAADAGLQPGDVIQEVNHRPVRTIEELRAAVTRPSRKPMLLSINRSGQELFLSAGVS